MTRMQLCYQRGRVYRAALSICVGLAIGALWLSAWAFGFVRAAQAASAEPFDEKVQPILKQNCVPCHDDKTRTSGLSVISKADLLGGGSRGPVILAGKPDDSILIKILRGRVEPRMPLGGQPLSEDKIAILADWIKNLEPTDLPTTSTWWAFKAPKAMQLPAVKNQSWVRNGIDNFVLSKLEENGLSPSPEAPPRTLVRRVFFDLIGLPPTPSEVDVFLQDKSPDAYEKLIDRLLADPRYGERWGRHWLDLARYADTRGYEGDPEYSHAWRYRDYVIQSFNNDKPYDRFVKEQMAGDEMAPDDPDDDLSLGRRARPINPEGQVAVGFLRLAPWFPGGGPAIQVRQSLLDEMTATVGSVFLGLTVKCAQCHNHKYDPIPQKDYYRMQAFFAPLEFAEEHVEFSDPELRARMDASRAQHTAQLKAAQEKFKQYQDSLLAKLSDIIAQGRASAAVAAGTSVAPAIRGPGDPGPKTDNIKADIQELTKRLTRDDNGVSANLEDTTFSVEEKQKYLELLALVDNRNSGIQEPGLLPRQVARYEPMVHTIKNISGSPTAPNRPITHVLTNGEYDKLGEVVEPGFLSAIAGNSDPAPLPTQGAGNVSHYRLVLADWIANPDNSLTARVMANRIWQYHFGAGIVATSSDFGKNGAKPTHPELLDWLAFQFVQKHWSIKAMHRLILTSSTYRQSSEHSTEAAVKLDPSNTLLWRMNRTRLEGEVMRDSVLAVSGRLNPERGGPGIFPPVPDEVANLRIKSRLVWEPDDGPEGRRRSVYIMQRRQLEVPFMNVMDAGILNDSCERRFVSTTPLQALTLMDGMLVNEEAKYFAQRLAETAGPNPVSQIRLAFELAFARPPVPEEVRKGMEYLQSGGNLTGLCRIIFNTNEFVYVR